MPAENRRPGRNSLRGRQDDEEALRREVTDLGVPVNVGAPSSAAPRDTSETLVSREETVSGLPENSDEPADREYAREGPRPATNQEATGPNNVFSHAVRRVDNMRRFVASMFQHANAQVENTNHEEDNGDSAESFIFLCGGNERNSQRAVVVPVYETIPLMPMVQPVDPEPRDDTDEVIYRRLRYYWKKYFRTWHQYIPFYGIKDVRETDFEFEPRVHEGGVAIRISVKPLNIEAIRKIVNDHKESTGSIPQLNTSDAEDSDSEYLRCELNRRQPCDLCAINRRRPAPSSPFVKRRAEDRLWLLDHRHYIKMSFKDPTVANSLDTLTGMVQRSCLYSRHKLRYLIPEKGDKPWSYQRMRGIYVEVGWDIELMRARLPLVVFVLFSLVLFLRLVSGDWNLALQAGQFLAALVALGVPIAMHMVQER